MRISTGMIFDAGVASINKQTETMLNLQQQVASGKRILTPADDPVGAARVIEVTQMQSLTTQYSTNLLNATDTSSLEDSQLSSATNLLGNIRDYVIQSGDATLGDSGRKNIATALSADFQQLMGIANATDASGQYLFAGYMGNTKPFGGTVTNGVTYSGDEGQRKLQVSPTQQIAISDSGNDIFNRITNGNGTFATSYSLGNTGSGNIDAGSLTNLTNWKSASNSGNLQVQFWVDAAGTIGPAGATYYDLVDATSGNSLFSPPPAPSTAGGAGNTFTHAYTSGQPIGFSGLAAPYNDFGASVTIKGAPASGDSFTLQKSSSQSVFDTVRNLILTLQRPAAGSPSNSAKLTSDLNAALINIDHATQNIMTVRAGIGSRLNEATSLQSVNTNLNLQYAQTLSNLQDTDYTKAVTALTQAQTQLQAAQKSFVSISQLSLFSYLP
jgi:flagellar hook-associated protein 3 FlgL